MTLRFLVDQNLSRRLSSALGSFAWDGIHVAEVGLSQASDREVWAFAKWERRTILSKDADFHHLSFLLGSPPKVIWLRLGNCSTDQAILALQTATQTVEAFEADPTAALLILPAA